jgi:hypothetical protein
MIVAFARSIIIGPPPPVCAMISEKRLGVIGYLPL